MKREHHTKSAVQRFFTTLLFPWAESIEEHSRAWKIRCSCGHETSVWERGGVRWHAKGSPRRYAICEGCGERSWLRLEWDDR